MAPDPESNTANSLPEPDELEHELRNDCPRPRIGFRLVLEQLGSCGPMRLTASKARIRRRRRESH